MRTAFLAICFLALLQSVSLGQVEVDIPATNRVILEPGDWKPSEGETLKALVSIKTFLQQSASRQSTNPSIKFILGHLRSYRVQFIGIKHEDRKIIWCNFFPARSHFNYWRERRVHVFDGGAWFWHVEYDPNNGQCSEFIVNGVA